MSQETVDPAVEIRGADLAEALAVAIVVVGDGARVHYVNGAAEDLFGIGRRHIVGRPLAEMVTLEDAWQRRLDESLAGGQAFVAREVALQPVHRPQAERVDATRSLIDAGESPECPDCGSMSLYFSEGCKTCESCGWSEC